MIKFRASNDLQNENGVFCTYILVMDKYVSQEFFSDMLIYLDFFKHSFVVRHSRSLQTLLTLESSNVQSADPTEIDKFKGDIHF